MLRAFFLLLSILADCETVTGITRVALLSGLANASIFACIGVRLAIRPVRKSRPSGFSVLA